MEIHFKKCIIKKEVIMIENLNDLISILILLLFPMGIIIVTIMRILKKRRINRKESEGRYYSEW